MAYIVKCLIDTEIDMSVSELERVFGVIMFTVEEWSPALWNMPVVDCLNIMLQERARCFSWNTKVLFRR